MNPKKLFSILLSVFILSSFISTDKAKSITWADISDVGYRRTFSPQYSSFYDKPIFSREISSLENQKIQITGYIIPIDTYGEKYFLSSQPNSSCYFCGKGQKHEVIELKLKNLPVNYKMDEFLSFEGVFHTHTDMFMYYPYSLENAVLVK